MIDYETKKELRTDLMDHFRNLSTYWSKVDCSEKDRCNGLLHSILATIDGCSAFNCMDLYMEYGDDKVFINDDTLLHELLWYRETTHEQLD